MSVQRFELVDVGTYSETRELVEAPSNFAEHADKRWAHEDYWCRAQEVFDLEAAVAALEERVAELEGEQLVVSVLERRVRDLEALWKKAAREGDVLRGRAERQSKVIVGLQAKADQCKGDARAKAREVDDAYVRIGRLERHVASLEAKVKAQRAQLRERENA